jgi:transcriptional regulator with XRE-family HTH domain
VTPAELRAARQKLGLTQAQLGEALRLRGTRDGRARVVRQWEAGERQISGPVEIAIEHLLHCRPQGAQIADAIILSTAETA